MMKTVAIIAPSAMGAAVASVLTAHRVEVLTLLTGRSSASAARPRQAKMTAVNADELMKAEAIFSIVPPANAMTLATELAPLLARSRTKPLYVDCNAVSARQVGKIHAVIDASGAGFVDGAIIGLPPSDAQEKGPRFWFAGDDAPKLSWLSDAGLRVKIMAAEVGAASALKMSYAGINKGITLLSTLMLINASRAGAAEALWQEMTDSQPALMDRLRQAIPDMYSKAWRWAPEMQEIASLNQGELPGDVVYHALAQLCRQLADNQQHQDDYRRLLNNFLQRKE
ncbi:phosphogluconate dehydrogenase [Erwinia sp. OLTSP20]|uniref:NAD(P)-dependent oxidoreductase n=1 Tax=unclassified Erwinia TaxID=2622719 RepID=UPI000C4843B9|nr:MULTISPECIES: NAD(P)-dependent oxidoreductase [unclassified Erwinia]PIJ51713.1 phosphogluconate dehydrogenase [Erwinia sp. OAMSP11]PIJ75600.1 phosphogluconate dehydrogenase [Erwinia sp. OLSSP12]PIJ84905.1 phosphogluconate dehydrogenase [Erwinia sp. OLCASP19]PIJ86684.1 phosphogluconate dehydrogenase [Erwinia sp. OLMTSP26]PIJ88125.1 phosphogluconate dehydrogenase [Erwinia sp. OLMDSP33]